MLALHTHMLTQYVSIVFVRTFTKSLDANNNNKAHAQPKLTANARNKAVNQNPFFPFLIVMAAVVVFVFDKCM